MLGVIKKKIKYVCSVIVKDRDYIKLSNEGLTKGEVIIELYKPKVSVAS